MTDPRQMHEVEVESVTEAERKLRLLNEFGTIERIKVLAAVDLDELLDEVTNPSGRSWDGSDDDDAGGEKDTFQTPEEIVDLAEENGIPPIHVLREAAERVDGMFVRVPEAEDLGLDDAPETQITETAREALEELAKLSEATGAAEIDESPETPAPSPGVAENGTLGSDEEYKPKAGGQPNVEKNYDEWVAQGERKDQVLYLLRENEGDWVTGRDVAELAGDLDPEDSRDRAVGSRALMNAYERGWLEDDIEINRRNGALHQYRYNPDGADEPSDQEEEETAVSGEGEVQLAETEHQRTQNRSEGQTTFGEVPGQVSKGTQQHEVLALLTHLYHRTGEPQTLPDLAEYARLERSKISTSLSGLKRKNLVRHEKADDPSEPGEWEPTEAAKAELERTGGFQVNG